MQVLFDSLNINDNVNYFLTLLNHEGSPASELDVQKIARSNESTLLRKGFRTKIIQASVTVIDTTLEALDSRLDTFKKTIEGQDKNLDVDFASGTRRYICTGFISSVDRKPRQAVINLRFECYKATGEDTTATTTTKSGKTTTPYTDTLAVGGSAPAQPIITITLNSFTGTSLRWMKFKNVDTGEAVLITASDWAGSDSIIINCETMIVTKNGVAIAYNGFVPTFPVGTVNWEYSDSFTARNVNIVFAAKHRWL